MSIGSIQGTPVNYLDLGRYKIWNCRHDQMELF